MSTAVGFNYDGLKNAKVRAEAKKHAEHINKLLKSSTEGVVEIGRRLNAMRETMTSTEFRAWIFCEFRWQQSTSANYMQAARVFGDLDCLAKFQPTALIMLARTNVPEEIVKRMIERARSGETITTSEVKNVLAGDASFIPARKDAGVVRKPESVQVAVSVPDIRPAPIVVESKLPVANVTPVQPAPITIESLRESLDAFAASIARLQLAQADRDALANRFFDLAVQLRTQPSPPQPPKPTKPRTSKAAV